MVERDDLWWFCVFFCFCKFLVVTVVVFFVVRHELFGCLCRVWGFFLEIDVCHLMTRTPTFPLVKFSIHVTRLTPPRKLRAKTAKTDAWKIWKVSFSVSAKGLFSRGFPCCSFYGCPPDIFVHLKDCKYRGKFHIVYPKWLFFEKLFLASNMSSFWISICVTFRKWNQSLRPDDDFQCAIKRSLLLRQGWKTEHSLI